MAVSPYMSEDEICRRYRQAGDCSEQLQILAELNCVSRQEIIDILVHNGETVRLPLPKRGRRRSTEMNDEEYRAALLRRLNVLVRRIEGLMQEYREIAAVLTGGGIPKYCCMCKWYDINCGVCCNGDSEHRTDFQCLDGTCEKWEENGE